VDVFLYVRRTEDWCNVSSDFLKNNFFKDFGKGYNWKEDIFDRVVWWDELFNLSYTGYRCGIKEIAKSQHYFKTISWKNFYNLSNDDIVIPVDDDDWFHPDLANLILDKCTNCEVGFWDPLVFCSTFTFKLNDWNVKKKKYFASNGYFIKSSLLYEKGYDFFLSLLLNHCGALETSLKNNLKIKEIKNKYLSIYNSHPGSLTSLNGINKKIEFLHYFPRNNIISYRKDQLWCKHSVEKLIDLIKSVELKSPLKLL